MKTFLCRLKCALFGHEFTHRRRLNYRATVNWCARCQSPIYEAALREIAEK